MAELTIIFADLTGSTGMFETLGNAKATDAVTRTTQWMGKLTTARGGRVIKYLGDGALFAFTSNTAAVNMVVEMQRLHMEHITSWPEVMQAMRFKIGLARGEVVEQEGDCFGDAVNVASRLSDLAGADQILATHSVIEQLSLAHDIRYRNLGNMNLRGRSEPALVYRIDWQLDITSSYLTVPAGLDVLASLAATAPPAAAASLELSFLDQQRKFIATEMPVFLGRGEEANFVVSEQSVSRLHVRLEFRGDAFVLTDISSYGTWVRFAGTDSVIALRRQECLLLTQGEIALGAPFDDFSVPTVTFRVGAGSSLSAPHSKP